MSNRFRAVALVGVGLGMGLLVGVGMLVGALIATGRMAHDRTSQDRGGYISLPETALHATASAGGDTFAIATGPIDDEVEGLFTLDFLTGDLKCLVINPRNGRWSSFEYNVLADLGVAEKGKASKLLMVTGAWSMRASGAGAGRPAASVVYVADAVTGNVGVYSVPWNRSIPPTGGVQGGALVQVALGKVRNLAVRDN